MARGHVREKRINELGIKVLKPGPESLNGHPFLIWMRLVVGGNFVCHSLFQGIKTLG
ncbi:MAG: hypothetical protein ACP5J5_05590 [Dissulfurimicrobium sp.]|uniref:hypothetical protein n=1 Tax=Dissulfurimicrobium hydrothermale TaxID=1750598 RepID=UPI003C762DB3